MTTNTNKHIATRKLSSGLTIRVTVERGTWTEQKNWDGYEMGTETHVVNRTEIALLDGSGKVLTTDSEIRPLEAGRIAYAKQYKQAVESGCVGMLGKAFVKQDTADIIAQAIAEADAAAPKTAEQIAIETDETERQAKAEAWRNSPEGKADAEAMRSHNRLMRKMDRADSDY